VAQLAYGSGFGSRVALCAYVARLTLDTYTQSVTAAKREAQEGVMRLLVRNDPSTLAAPA
jgi:hypothetical protein